MAGQLRHAAEEANGRPLVGRPRFKAILFDNGGTLFARTSAPEAIRTLAAERGVELTLDQARARWAQVKAAQSATPAARLARNRSGTAHRASYLQFYRPLEEIGPGMAAAMYARYKTNPQTMVPYADTPRTLRALRAHGISIGIVSNTGWNIREGYQRAGLEALIDVFVLSHEHGAAKPDPVLIARACRELGVGPAQALMVGNDAPADGGAATRLGCPCLILPPAVVGSVRGLDHVLAIAGLAADLSGDPRVTDGQVLVSDHEEDML
ncbi:MAG TPA: HAD-IA family hydrolase [Streptosporangiaceae bacterium]|nr:HAD-IA family hydrolase [Streptosporangiaceae bacterium]